MKKTTLVLAGYCSLLLAAASVAETQPGKSTGRFINELRIGFLAHDLAGAWSQLRKEKGQDINLEVIGERSRFHLLRAVFWPNAGITLNTSGATSKVYGGILAEWSTKRGPFFSAGLGLAAHNGNLNADRKYLKRLGTPVLFRVPLELGCAFGQRSRVSIMFAHVSNGYLGKYNEGLDVVGLRYGFRF